MKQIISIVIPIFNEEKVLHELCKRLKKIISSNSKYNFEIIMVENGSFDDSLNLLTKERQKNKNIKILQLVKNVGTDGALVAGLSFAKGDAAVVMMADLQDVPELIPQFLEKWKEGYDIIYGIVKKREKLKFTRKFSTFLFYKFIKLITNNLVIENASDFRLMDKKVYSLVTKMPEHNKFFRGLVSWTGFKQTGIAFNRPPRFAGESKAYFKTVAKVALNGIFSFSALPFFLPIIFSLLLILLTVLLLLLNQFILSLQTFMFSILFFILGIILEYIRRIFNEVQNRPHFIIRERIGFN